MSKTVQGRDELGRVIDMLVEGMAGPAGPKGDKGDPGITKQPAIANVNRAGLATDQITALQDKVDEVLVALRNAGVIST